MNKQLICEIDKQKEILYALINSKAPYEQIVEQSQVLDTYILKFMKIKPK